MRIWQMKFVTDHCEMMFVGNKSLLQRYMLTLLIAFASLEGCWNHCRCLAENFTPALSGSRKGKQSSEQSGTEIHIAPTSAMLVAVLSSLPEKLYTWAIENKDRVTSFHMQGDYAKLFCLERGNCEETYWRLVRVSTEKWNVSLMLACSTSAGASDEIAQQQVS